MSKKPKKDWLVVGGGLQGCYFASLLSHHYKNVAILDPQPRLLQRWLQRSKACRMKFMRSTSMHHLAPNPGDLLDFAQIRGYGSEHFAEPYLRPSLALFNAHSQEIVHNFRLDSISIPGELCALKRIHSSWEIEYIDATAQKKQLQSENILLALGDRGLYSKKTWHLSDPDFSLEKILAQRPHEICLVGAGISSAQLALHLLEQGIPVKIHNRYPLRCFQFDSEPSWLFKSLTDFQAEPDLAKRWQIILKERHKGSIPPQLYEKLQAYQREGLLQIGAPSTTKDSLTILATGLHFSTPNWLLQVAAEMELPLLHTESGAKPALRNSLLWDAQKAPGLYLTGRLGELFLGPAAGNIAGARIAARYLPVETKHSGSFLGSSAQ